MWEGLNEISQVKDGFVTTLDSTDKVLNRLRLVDRETGEVIKAQQGGKLTSYSFDMDGKPYRKFRCGCRARSRPPTGAWRRPWPRSRLLARP